MIGIDLVHWSEFEKQLENGGQVFLDRFFSAVEQQDCRPEHLAGLWAAKEAVIKALGDNTLKMNEIMISYDEVGRPTAKARGSSLELSISHHGEYAIAVALKQ